MVGWLVGWKVEVSMFGNVENLKKHRTEQLTYPDSDIGSDIMLASAPPVSVCVYKQLLICRIENKYT